MRDDVYEHTDERMATAASRVEVVIEDLESVLLTLEALGASGVLTEDAPGLVARSLGSLRSLEGLLA